jgi:hypothetical protein
MRVMSKKIDATLKDLTKALENHAKVVGGRTVSLKKSQRAAAKLQATATAYAAAVYSKTGLDSPFNDVVARPASGQRRTRPALVGVFAWVRPPEPGNRAEERQ